jgi:hypothetical protein
MKNDENTQNRYEQLIEKVFFDHYTAGQSTVPFRRTDIEDAARHLGIHLPKNLGDLIYSFRFRTQLPRSIQKLAPEGSDWVIQLAGRAKYRFAVQRVTLVVPRTDMARTKIPDATPGIIVRYALNDEQALLARLRYNRLIDIFARVTCYSLQSHLRTTVANMGQVETDEIYVGIDRRGAQYVFPVQAKGGRDRQNIVQIEQDIALCREKFPQLICRPIAAQFLDAEAIALFEFEDQSGQIVVSSEKHYRLVPQEEVTDEDLAGYRRRRLDS